MIEHKVIMHGPAVRTAGVTPAVMGAVLSRLGESLHGAVDVAFRLSSGPGRRQPWLRRAGQVELKDAEKTGDHEMTMFFEAPAFGDVAEDYYRQPSLFGEAPSREDTAFDVLGDAVGDVLSEKADSDRFDVGLLKRFRRLGAAVFEKKQVNELLILGPRMPLESPCRLSSKFEDMAQDLYMKTPRPTRARIAGKLDMIEASTMAFALLMPGGQRVRGVWRGNEFETLRSLVNSDVVAAGMAVYRPSGRLLRIDADVLAPQREADRFFAVVPTPTGSKMDLKSLLREQHSRGGMAAVWGRLPAEETDEEFLTAVAEMG